MEDNVTIQVNLFDGSVSIQAPTESLDVIFNRLETFIPKMVDAQKAYSNAGVKRNDLEAEPEAISATHPEKHTEEKAATEKNSSKTKSGSGKKLETNKMVDLKLTPEQREKFREFYQLKSPKGQNESLLVIIYWLTKTLDKNIVTRDEIYTGLKTVNERIPTRIAAVISNLRLDGKILSEEDGVKLHHTGEDFVDKDLPKKAAGKK